MQYSALVEEAKKAMQNAYCPYSNFSVGAALLTRDGRIYRGCNVENASYGASNCAERTALFSAIADGAVDFKAMAIVSSSEEYTYPCGICRQVIGELMPKGKLVFSGQNNQYQELTLKDLLPYAFTKDDLK